MSRFQKTIYIIHFQAIELYPPILNLLEFASLYYQHLDIKVITNNSSNIVGEVKYSSEKIHIKRLIYVSKNFPFYRRIFGYFYFNIYCILTLFSKLPRIVFYYETISAFPALVYKLITGNKSVLFAHYHEYTTPGEYKSGMVLNKINHWLEQKCYHSYAWISHTNEFRLNKFRSDISAIKMEKIYFAVMPNYPSKNWECRPMEKLLKPYKLVMVGAIGYTTMYLRELVEWVAANPDILSLDLYSNNIEDEAASYLKLSQHINVRLKSAVPYQELPEILKKYDIGIVMYKPFSENTIYAASNKLFEYLIVGLDVWFPGNMLGTIPYIRQINYPKILPLDFNNLKQLDIESLANRVNLTYLKSEFVYENVFQEIFEKLSKDLNLL